MVTIAIIGKTNVGKTTFFNAATLLNAEISTHPFTTREPNEGAAYVCDVCVCRELGVKDNPQNSACIEGWRYAPIRLLDLPGLIKDAWRGRGLGTRFLSVIGQADALIHIVDASGSVDEEGRLTKPGSGNPVQDVLDIEMEVERWMAEIILRNRQLISREASSSPLGEAVAKVLSGIKAGPSQVEKALIKADLIDRPIERWDIDEALRFSATLLPLIKPILIVANKTDLPTAEENLEMLINFFNDRLVAPCSAEAELILRRAERMGLLHYTPGQEKFILRGEARLTPEQWRALEYVEKRVMARWLRTGIQQALNTVVFKLLRMNMVYPVADESRYSDNYGNILPDVHLMPDGSTPLDLARTVHTRLAESYIMAVDAKTGMRLPKEYHLRHRDVIKIVTQPRAKPKR